MPRSGHIGRVSGPARCIAEFRRIGRRPFPAVRDRAARAGRFRLHGAGAGSKLLLAAAALVVQTAGVQATQIRTPAAALHPDTPVVRVDPARVRVTGDPGLSTRDAGRALEGAMTRQDLEESLAALGRRLIADGFMESELRLQVDIDGEAVIFLRRGDRAQLGSLAVTGPHIGDGPGPPRPEVRPGRFEPQRFQEAIWHWVDRWTESGHPFAWAAVESLDVRDGVVRAHLRLDPGPLVTVEEVRFPGRAGTRQGFLERWTGFRPGRPYRESDWTRARRRLEQIGLFEWVDVHMLSRSGSDRHVVSVPVREGPHNRLQGMFGYSGQTKTMSGFLDLEVGNLFGTGRRLAILWERVRTDQGRTRLRYREPLLGPLPVGGRLRLEQEDRDSTYNQVVVEVRAETSLGTDLAISGGLEYRRALLGPEPSERIRRVSSVIGLSWDTIRPGRWQGGRFSVDYWSGESRVRPPDSGRTLKWGLDRVEVDSERFWRPASGWASRVRVRGAALSRADSVPRSEALRLGGIASVRGFEEEELATARHVSLQLEAGPAFPEGRFYAFLDAARFRRPGIRARDEDAIAYGIGISSETGARGVSVDLGLRRGAVLREGRLHLRVQTLF